MATPLDTRGESIPNWGPASKLVAITPSDVTDLTALGIRSLYIGGAGNVAIQAINDAAPVTLTAVPAGTILPILPAKVMSTGTTATLIIGLAG